MATLRLTLRLHKICHIARNRQVPKFNSRMLKMCTVEYNLPPTNLLFAIHITAGKPKFYNFCKNSNLFFGTWAHNVSRNNTTDCFQCSYITKPSAFSVFNGPFLRASALHIFLIGRKKIWRYFSRLPYFYILYEIMLAINIKKWR
jgi:hypothetical protein